VTLDLTPPQVTITSPASQSIVFNPVVITANASDAYGIRYTYFYKGDGTYVGPVYGPPFVTSLNLPLGNQTIYVTAVDKVGNVGASAPISFFVGEKTPPTIALLSPTNGSTLTGAATLTASASDNVSVASVQFVKDTTVIPATRDVDGTYKASWDTISDVPGTHSIKARAYDSSGNMTETASITVTTPDQLPPSAPSNLAPTRVLQNEVDLAWSPSTDNTNVGGYRISRNGYQIAQIGPSTTYQDLTVRPPVTCGTYASYMYTVVAFDAAGNVSASSNSVTVTIGAAPCSSSPPPGGGKKKPIIQ